MFANDSRAGGIEIPSAQMNELVELHCILDGACITATINSETGENVDKLITNIGMSSAHALIFTCLTLTHSARFLRNEMLASNSNNDMDVDP